MSTAIETPINESLKSKRERAAQDIRDAESDLARAATMPRSVELPEGPLVSECGGMSLWQFMQAQDELVRERDKAAGRVPERLTIEADANAKRREAVRFLRETASGELKSQIASLEKRREMYQNRISNATPALEAARQLESLEKAIPRWRNADVRADELRQFASETGRSLGPVLSVFDTKNVGMNLPVGAVQLRQKAEQDARDRRQKLLELIVSWGEKKLAALRAKSAAIETARRDTADAETQIKLIDSELNRLDVELLKP